MMFIMTKFNFYIYMNLNNIFFKAKFFDYCFNIFFLEFKVIFLVKKTCLI